MTRARVRRSPRRWPLACQVCLSWMPSAARSRPTPSQRTSRSHSATFSYPLPAPTRCSLLSAIQNSLPIIFHTTGAREAAARRTRNDDVADGVPPHRPHFPFPMPQHPPQALSMPYALPLHTQLDTASRTMISVSPTPPVHPQVHRHPLSSPRSSSLCSAPGLPICDDHRKSRHDCVYPAQTPGSIRGPTNQHNESHPAQVRFLANAFLSAFCATVFSTTIVVAHGAEAGHRVHVAPTGITK